MQMERFEEHMLNHNVEESPEFIDFHESEENIEGAAPEAVRPRQPPAAAP